MCDIVIKEQQCNKKLKSIVLRLVYDTTSNVFNDRCKLSVSQDTSIL